MIDLTFIISPFGAADNRIPTGVSSLLEILLPLPETENHILRS